MLTFFSNVFAKILPYLLLIGGAISALALAKNSGISAEKQAQVEAQLKFNQKANNVSQNISTLSDTNVTNELHQFNRD